MARPTMRQVMTMMTPFMRQASVDIANQTRMAQPWGYGSGAGDDDQLNHGSTAGAERSEVWGSNGKQEWIMKYAGVSHGSHKQACSPQQPSCKGN